jgi:hypothetical protein
MNNFAASVASDSSGLAALFQIRLLILPKADARQIKSTHVIQGDSIIWPAFKLRIQLQFHH